MRIELPNAVSIVIGTGIAAGLLAAAGVLTQSGDLWPLVAAALLGGLAKAVQVWVDSRQLERLGVAQDPPSKLATFLVG